MEPGEQSEVPAIRAARELWCIQQSIVRLDQPLQARVRAWNPPLFRGPLDVRDITQSTWAQFCQFCRQHPEVAGEPAAHWPLARRIAWLLFLAACRHLRRQRTEIRITIRRQRQTPSGQAAAGGVEAVDGAGGVEPCCSRPSPAEIVAAADLARHLLAKLDIGQRQVLMLQIQGHSDPLIGQRLHISQRSVRRTRRQARNRLSHLADSQ